MRAALLGLVGAMLATSIAGAAPTPEEPINDWASMRAFLLNCWTPPEGPDGSIVTFVFMLSRGGGLKGPPRMTARILKGSAGEQKAFEQAAHDVLSNCLPLNLTPSFQRQMGESLITLRFTSGPKVPAANLASLMSLFSSEKKAAQ